jgi:polyisoprenoid-binding protein YceI
MGQPFAAKTPMAPKAHACEERVEDKGKDRLAITGDLTIRGATREVVVESQRM